MDNYDKLYQQYRQASQKSESKDFPAMDKVWTRLEDKLDAKIHKKQSKTWKKLAIAASVLLLVSLGYQLFKPNDMHIPKNEVGAIEKDTVKIISPLIIQDKKIVTEQAIVISEKANPILRKNADEILRKQLNEQETVGYQGKIESAISTGLIVLHDSISKKAIKEEVAKSSAAKEKSGSAFMNRTLFETRIVQKQNIEEDKSVGSFVPKSYAAKAVQSKTDPLVVIDGEAVKAKMNASYDETVRSELHNLGSDEVESVVVLPDPLYIINGISYSEESLFGKKPTSPYAPLSQQEIESISILQGNEAIKAYGEKGAKGVVIITTKNGKPAPKK